MSADVRMTIKVMLVAGVGAFVVALLLGLVLFSLLD